MLFPGACAKSLVERVDVTDAYHSGSIGIEARAISWPVAIVRLMR